MRSGGWRCCAAGPRTSTAAPRWAGWSRSSPGRCRRVRSCGPRPRRATRGAPTGSRASGGALPRDAVGGVEVLRGGASDLYGSTALGGVVQVLTRPLPPGPELRAEASAGNEGTLDGSLAMEGRAGAWGSRLAAAGFRTDGYVPVEEASRGPVDTRAASRHGVADLRVERSWAEAG